ncbi:MAG: hypothetical protein L3J56_09455 [Bacteroidales bacterium]|nr:hypothetical protein [Bacteroidales bacterium]
MKNILITVIIATLALVNIQAQDEIETCKTYISEAKSFQDTMHKDKVSDATLAFYKDKVVAYCGNIASKMPFEKKFFANTLMKKDTTTVSNCKLAIEMAHAYDEGEHTSPFIANAHKVNMADNCGTLVAKKVPAFCLFDVVDNSTEDLKEKCLASIDKAHAAMGTNSVANYKAEVVVNCGRLHASL